MDPDEKQRRIDILRRNLQGYRDRLEEIQRQKSNSSYAVDEHAIDFAEFHHEQLDIRNHQRKDELRLLIFENPEEARRINAFDAL